MLGPNPPPQASLDPGAHAFGSAGPESGLAAEIRDMLAHLRRRRLAIVLATLVMAGLGAVMAGFMPRLYTATAQILVDPRGLRVFGNEVTPGGQVSDVQSSLVETQSRVLTSDSVLDPVVQQQRLAEDPEFNGTPHNALGAAAQAVRQALVGSVPADKAATALARLGDRVKVQRLPGSFVLELQVQSADANKAARLAEAITNTFIANQEQMRQDAAKRVSDGLAMRLDELSGAVNRAERAVDTFARENNIVDTNGRPLSQQQLGDTTNQLVAARVRTGELQARYNQVQKLQQSGAVPDSTSEAVQSPAITQLRARYAAAQQQVDNLRTTLGPHHPSLISAQSQLQGVRKLIAEEIGRLAASARSDYERAKASQDNLEAQVTAVTQENGVVNTATIHLRQLEREAQARRAVYESFLTRSRETGEEADVPVTNISVISAAVPPLKAGGIPALLIMAIMAAFGASAAATGILAWDHLRGRLVTPRQFALATALPLLGLVRRRSASSVGRFGRRRKPEPLRPGTSGQGLSTLTGALDDLAPRVPPRIVLFVSDSEAAAEARLPLDLARLACEAGKRVLLIDADDDTMTRPLDTGTPQDRRGWPSVKRTIVPNLSVLPWKGSFGKPLAQDAPANQSAVLRLAADHDFIFVHGSGAAVPPRLRALADVASTIVLLIDSEAASIGDVEAIRHEIGAFASKVAGFVWVTPGGAEGRVARRATTPAEPKASEAPQGYISTRTDAA